MKKRILAIVMAVIMLTGTSPLTADASEIFNEPATEEEVLADAPAEETNAAETQSAVSEEVAITEEPQPEINVNSEVVTSISEPAETPVPSEDESTEAPAAKAVAPVQEESKEEIEEEAKVTPSDAQEEPEEQVEDVIEIEEEETPLAGPAQVSLAINNMSGETGAFLVGDDFVVTKESKIEKLYVNNDKEKYRLWVLPGTEGFEIERNNTGRRDNIWWCWDEGAPNPSEISARVKNTDGKLQYVIGDKENKKYWSGGDMDQVGKKAIINVGEKENTLNEPAILRVLHGSNIGISSKYRYNNVEGKYYNLSLVTQKNELKINIYVVKKVNIIYNLNYENADGNDTIYAVPEGKDGIGVTYGYTTGKETTSQKMTVLSAPDREDKRYTFAGWNTKQDGTGEWYTADTTFQITDDMTLYAQWKTEYTVEYYLDGILKESTEVKGYENQPISPELYAENKYENQKFYFKEKNLESPIITADTVLKVYYVSKAKYTVKYYKDSILADEETGEGKINELIPYDSQKYFGYSLKTENPTEGRTEITVKDEENVLSVYYEKTSGDLVINTGNSAQTSIFEIKGPNGLSMHVTVVNTLTIKSLPAGAYQVRELSGWTWRCNRNGNEIQSVTIPAKGERNVTFGSLGSRNQYWFGAEAQKPNDFGTIKEQEGGTNE